MTRRTLTLLALFALALVLSTQPLSAQCAMCRLALASPEGQKLIGALRGGILVLLAAPFAVFGTIAAFAVRMQRQREE